MKDQKATNKKPHGPGVTKVALRRHRQRYERKLDYELCVDLADKFAWLSARCSPDIGDIRTRYLEIAAEFRCLRSSSPHLSPTRQKRLFDAIVKSASDGEAQKKAIVEYVKALRPKKFDPPLAFLLRERYRDHRSLKQLLSALEEGVRHYLSALMEGESYEAQLDDYALPSELMRPLAKELLWRRTDLMKFLSSIFERWRKIDEPDSLWRRQTLIHQWASKTGHDRKAILEALQSVGAIHGNVNSRNQTALLSSIGKHISRVTAA